MKAETRSFYEQCVRRAVEEIVAGLDGAIELTQLAQLALMSPFHFHRVFRGMVGETPLELARRLRLERAAWRLVGGSAVTEVAFEAGYETHEAFTRSFRSRYGCSPTEFRQRHQAWGRGGAAPSCERPPQIELPARCGVHFLGGAFSPFINREAVMDVQIEKHEAQRVAAVRHVGPYSQISQAFARLGQLAGALLGSPGARMVGIYHDDPESVPPAELRADAGVVVAAGVPLPDGLVEVWLPAGRYAHAVHRGSYEKLGDAWARFMGQWLPAAGERLGAGPSYEVYPNTPMTAKEEDLRTEMYLPLA
jgi:AraC family transcriptional regulator